MQYTKPAKPVPPPAPVNQDYWNKENFAKTTDSGKTITKIQMYRGLAVGYRNVWNKASCLS